VRLKKLSEIGLEEHKLLYSLINFARKTTSALPSFPFQNLCFALGGGAVFFFVFSVFKWYVAPGTPIHSWDEVDYYRSAGIFYDSPSLMNLWQSPRPNYMWLPALLLKFCHIPFTANVISALTAFLAWGIMLWSSVQAYRLLESGKSFFLFSLTLLISLPVNFLFSVSMLADLLHAAVFIALTVSALNLIKGKNSLNRSLAIYMGIGTFGLLTKPVFFLPMMLVNVFILLFAWTERSWSRSIKTKITAVSSIMSVLTLCVAYHYRDLISALYFNNEVLGYWAPEEIKFSKLLWFPIELLENLRWGHALGLFSMAILLLLKNKGKFNSKDLKLHLLVWGPWLIMTINTSINIQSKNIRVFLFLFLFPLLFFPLFVGRALKQHEGKLGWLLTSLCLLNTWILFFLTFSNNQQSILLNKINLSGRKIIFEENREAPLTYEDARIDDVFQLIKSDCLKVGGLCSPSELKIFLPQSGLINSSVFSNYTLFTNLESKKIGELNPPWRIHSGLFRYGGWFFAGGIPLSFFNSRYIIFYPKIAASHLPNDCELYNKVIHSKLAERHPAFLDGLEEINRLESKIGPIYIFRRNHIPSPTNFNKIVQIFKSLDPDNWWNHPFLDAAEKLEKTKWRHLSTNLNRFKAKEPEPKYTKAWNFPGLGDYSYPDFLQKIDLNP